MPPTKVHLPVLKNKESNWARMFKKNKKLAAVAERVFSRTRRSQPLFTTTTMCQLKTNVYRVKIIQDYALGTNLSFFFSI